MSKAEGEETLIGELYKTNCPLFQLAALSLIKLPLFQFAAFSTIQIAAVTDSGIKH